MNCTRAFSLGAQTAAALAAGIELPQFTRCLDLVGIWASPGAANLGLSILDGSGQVLFATTAPAVGFAGNGFWESTLDQQGIAGANNSIAGIPPKLAIDPNWVVKIIGAATAQDSVVFLLRGEFESDDLPFRAKR